MIVIMTVGGAEDARCCSSSSLMLGTSVFTSSSSSFSFSYTFRYIRLDWRCRGCVVMIIIMTVGDAEDAR